MNPFSTTTEAQAKPILLYNDECAICRRIGTWVQKSARSKSGEVSIIARPIGDDPKVLRALNPKLDIWDAYATIHVLMPDGSMKLGGEAVAEVLRDLPNTKWFAWCFAIGLFGFRPCQMILNLGYLILSDVRPLLGCESCGMPSFWVRPIVKMVKWVETMFSKRPLSSQKPHSTLHSVTEIRPLPNSGATASFGSFHQ
jgi:predicted DCC family thiol-disulfide oxidoreductase YuxK